MKKIEAIIRREKLIAVKEALDAIDSPGMMMWEIEGHGKQKGITEQFRGRQFKVDFLPKTKIEIVVGDSKVEQVVSTIIKIASTGQVGDGKIFISTIDETIRIRTGEKGEVAIG
jgi:nitrogen regulatory protein P-II 1